jgi:hypothetical protein
MNGLESIKKWIEFGVDIEKFVTNPPMAGAEVKVPMSHVEAAKVLMFHWGRSFRAYRALNLLVISGFPDDAIVLVRTLLEDLFEMAFIAKYPEDAHLYLEHGLKTEVAWWQEFREYAPEMMHPSSYFSEAITASEINDKFNKTRKATKSAWHPNCKSVRQRAIKTGVRSVYYDLMYSLASRYIHGSGDWMRELARSAENEGRLCYAGDAAEGALAVMFAGMSVVEQLNILNGCLCLNITSELSKLERKLNSLAAEEWSRIQNKYT